MSAAAGVDISFRRLGVNDLGLMHRWLNEPGVVLWWEGQDVTRDGVVAAYGPQADPAVEHWLACLAGDGPFGWIQCYSVTASPEELAAWAPFGIDDHACGVDYLVGEPHNRGHGLGSAMIRRFVHDIVFAAHPDWTQVCASPFVANKASWRALGKAGFTHLGDLDDPGGRCRLMALRRPVTPLSGA